MLLLLIDILKGGPNKLKKIVIMLLSVLMVFGVFSKQEASASTFSDVKNYQGEIDYLVSQKIISGYPDGTFKPTKDLTRIHAVTMILREKGITDYSAPNPELTDIKPGDKNYGIVAKAVELGFISGKVAKDGSKYFDPQGTLTRSQMAKILVLGYSLPINSSYSFSDVSATNGSRDFVSTLASENITTGYLDGTFKPNGKISRQHFAVFMARLLNDEFKPRPDLKVHFIDVGQGDSILIQSPNGKNMLIDGGTKSEGSKVVNFVKSKGISKLDYVVATHPDADHIGGLISVLNSFTVSNFVDSGKEHTSQTYYEMLQIIKEKNIHFIVPTTGDKINLDSELNIQVLNANEHAADNNDASIVLKVTYNKVSFLLAGDAGVDIEADMLSGFDVQSTVLKAGHHGSNTSSSAAFIHAVKPSTTILSYGKDNSYGHPHAEVVSRLKAVNSMIYSTAVSGDITVTSNGITHSVSAKPWTGTGTGGTTAPPTGTSDVKIVSKDLSGEVVGIKNTGKSAINLKGWTLVSVEGNQTYNFPNYSLAAGNTVYITSGPKAKEGSGYLKWTGTSIWNNNGDAAKLLNAQGVVVSEFK